MYDISADRPLTQSHTISDGLTNTMRGLRYQSDSFEIPRDKKPSAYSAAKLAGIKITVRDTGKGKAIIWRTDGPKRPLDDGLNIFGEPVKPTTRS